MPDKQKQRLYYDVPGCSILETVTLSNTGPTIGLGSQEGSAYPAQASLFPYDGWDADSWGCQGVLYPAKPDGMVPARQRDPPMALQAQPTPSIQLLDASYRSDHRSEDHGTHSRPTRKRVNGPKRRKLDLPGEREEVALKRARKSVCSFHRRRKTKVRAHPK